MTHFVHLQVQSQYSLLNSTCRISEVVSEGKRLGYEALAITDERTMYGVIPFYRTCVEQGIKPIIGMTAYVLDSEEHTSYPLVLLAKNNTGYENLIKIASALGTIHEEGIPLSILRGYAEGIIAMTPGVNGEIEQAILQQQQKKAISVAMTFKDIFTDFYISIQNHGLQEEIRLLLGMQELAGECDIPLVATNNVHYLVKEDAVVHDCLQAIKHGTKMEQSTAHILGSAEYYLKSPQEMEQLFEQQPNLLTNAVQIATQCNVTLDFESRHLPTFPLAEGFHADEVLKKLCFEGLKERGKENEKSYIERLSHELQVINDMKFSDYFLIVWDFMKYAHEQGILTGPGRGSAAGSLVAYVLRITDVDPIQYDLLFERFLNKDRVTLPDIDIDFPDYRRDDMIAYVTNKYGRLRVAQIVTFGTLAAKAAIRDVGRIKGLVPREVDRLSRFIPNRLGITLQEAYDESMGLRTLLEESQIHKEVFTIAKRIEGLPRHTSTHAAGVIMSDGKLTQYVPLQGGNGEAFTTQYDGETLEKLGLLKMDFLGLRNLTLIENVLTSIKKHTGKQLNLTTIPLHDKKTFALLSRGDTTGVFQLESSGMRKVLQSLKPTELEDIVAVNALYRPGPSQQIPTYIETKHEKKEATYLHPDLEPILKGTYGVMIYQEQIMKIASTLADFSLSEADLLRRAVSKKNKEVLDAERIPFVKGCVKNGYSEDVANDVYDLIVRFANYGFNRSHAVAYSIIGYQLAYLKTHYPTHFFSALLTSVIGSEEKIAQYISEAKQRQVTILPPTITKSNLTFTVEETGIRYPLTAMKGVGGATAREILIQREKQLYKDLFDLCARVSSRIMTRRLLETLIYAGVLDDFGQNRTTLLATIEAAMEYAELVVGEDSSQGDLFDDLVPKPKYVVVPEMTKEEKLQHEKETLGFYLTDHPTSAFIHLVQGLEVGFISDAKHGIGKTVQLLVYVVDVKRITTKKKQSMAFLILSDQSDEIGAVVFPTVYGKHTFKEGEVIFVVGRVEEKEKNLQIIVEEVQTVKQLKEYMQYKESKVYIKIAVHHSDRILIQAKQVLRKHPGLAQVIVFNEKTKKATALAEEYRIHPDEKCLYFLRQLLGEENIVLKNE